MKRKRVLLVDASPARRDLRSEAMRRLGMEVDCACNIGEARSWWRADLYSLVLINLEHDLGHWHDFCADLRVATPPQKLAFLVGKPEYLAESPNALGPEPSGKVEILEHTKPAEAAFVPTESLLPWGIMEASRRISAVRSVSAARSVALRNRPTPPRDLEDRASRRQELRSRLAEELRKEELL